MKVLVLDRVKGISDENCIQSLEQGTNLCDLDLGGSAITGKTIESIVKNNTKLVSLKISDCCLLKVKGWYNEFFINLKINYLIFLKYINN